MASLHDQSFAVLPQQGGLAILPVEKLTSADAEKWLPAGSLSRHAKVQVRPVG